MSDRTGADGGDMIVSAADPPTNVYRFMAGKAWGDGKDGAVVFQTAQGEELLRLESGGRVLVRGHECDNDPEVYRVFRAWLAAATVNDPGDRGPGADPEPAAPEPASDLPDHVCKECHAQGVSGKTFPSAGSTTDVGWAPFYDQAGVYHSHDPNGHAQSYRCEHGHTWSKTRTAPCPAPECGYGR